jgi:hypothetical protein
MLVPWTHPETAPSNIIGGTARFRPKWPSARRAQRSRCAIRGHDATRSRMVVYRCQASLRFCGQQLANLASFLEEMQRAGGALRATAFCRQRVKLPAARRPSLAGQYQLKDRTPSGVAARPQAAAMRLDDPPTDRQSHAGALRFGGEECVENALGLIDRKPDA